MSEQSKLCRCPCGCRQPVQDLSEECCDYCLEWHDYEEDELLEDEE